LDGSIEVATHFLINKEDKNMIDPNAERGNINSSSLNTARVFEVIQKEDPAQIINLMRIQEEAAQLCLTRSNLLRLKTRLKESIERRSAADAKIQALPSDSIVMDARNSSLDLLISICLAIPLAIGFAALVGVSLKEFKGQYLVLICSMVLAFGTTMAMKQTVYNAAFSAHRSKEKYNLSNRQSTDTTWQQFQDRGVWQIILVFIGLETAFDYLGLQQNVPPALKESPMGMVALFAVAALPSAANCFWAASTGNADGAFKRTLDEAKASPKEQQIFLTNQSNEVICSEMSEKIDALDHEIALTQAEISNKSDQLERSRKIWLDTVGDLCHMDLRPYQNAFFTEPSESKPAPAQLDSREMFGGQENNIPLPPTSSHINGSVHDSYHRQN
jgi:uncharacterized small protein (DUF1192 family)